MICNDTREQIIIKWVIIVHVFIGLGQSFIANFIYFNYIITSAKLCINILKTKFRLLSVDILNIQLDFVILYNKICIINSNFIGSTLL